MEKKAPSGDGTKKVSKSQPRPPITPIPRRSFDDDKHIEEAEIVRRFGGTVDDWEVKDGFWVVKS
jgi:hypothetical protein